MTFLTAYSQTLDQVTEMTPSVEIYTQDMGVCQSCLDLTSSCWACLLTTQQVFSDIGLTVTVNDGYYMVITNAENPIAVWHILGGYPQEGGYHN